MRHRTRRCAVYSPNAQPRLDQREAILLVRFDSDIAIFLFHFFANCSRIDDASAALQAMIDDKRPICPTIPNERCMPRSPPLQRR